MSDYFTHVERRKGTDASGTWPVLQLPEAKDHGGMTVMEEEMTAETRRLFEAAYAEQLEKAAKGDR